MLLNISVAPAPQIKSSADNSSAMINSGSGSTKDSDTEGFGKVLEREVSETTSKHETNKAPTATEPSENTKSLEDSSTTAASIAETTVTTDTTGTNNIINNLFIDIAIANKTDQPLLLLDPVLNPAMVTTTSILPTAISTLPQNTLIPQDNEQLTGSMLLSGNQLLQQRFAQINSTASNSIYSPGDLWQALDTAESAAYGKFLSIASEIGEAIQVNTEASMFSISDEPISSPSLGLSSTTSVASLNTTQQDVSVDLPVGQPKWGNEFAQKVVWLTNQQHQVAEIRLNPAHLGPVEVTLSIMQDQATAQFSSPHLAVREAIEEALPRLREMMAENGIQLGNVMVGADSFQQENKQQQAHNSSKGTATNSMGVSTENMGQVEEVILPNRHHGMVNTYA